MNTTHLRFALDSSYEHAVCENHWERYDSDHFDAEYIDGFASFCGHGIDYETVGEPEASDNCYYCGKAPHMAADGED